MEKYGRKEGVRDLLPAAILERPKSGMLVPVEGWFQGPLLGEARARLLDRPTLRGLVERDYLERLLAGRLRGLRPRRGAKIWLLVTLEAWLRGVLHGPPPRPGRLPAAPPAAAAPVRSPARRINARRAAARRRP